MSVEITYFLMDTETNKIKEAKTHEFESYEKFEVLTKKYLENNKTVSLTVIEDENIKKAFKFVESRSAYTLMKERISDIVSCFSDIEDKMSDIENSLEVIEKEFKKEVK